jgi:hypothetical protein
MTEPLQWVFAYCIAATIVSHVYLVVRIRERRKHYRRSQAARKAAATRKRNGTHRKPRQPEIPAGRHPFSGPLPKAKPPEQRVEVADMAWFERLAGDDDGEEPEYNEADPKTWQPVVRRIDGGAKEYRERPGGPGNV